MWDAPPGACTELGTTRENDPSPRKNSLGGRGPAGGRCVSDPEPRRKAKAGRRQGRWTTRLAAPLRQQPSRVTAEPGLQPQAGLAVPPHTAACAPGPASPAPVQASLGLDLRPVLPAPSPPGPVHWPPREQRCPGLRSHWPHKALTWYANFIAAATRGPQRSLCARPPTRSNHFRGESRPRATAPHAARRSSAASNAVPGCGPAPCAAPRRAPAPPTLRPEAEPEPTAPVSPPRSLSRSRAPARDPGACRGG